MSHRWRRPERPSTAAPPGAEPERDTTVVDVVTDADDGVGVGGGSEPVPGGARHRVGRRLRYHDAPAEETPELQVYVAKTQAALDLLALSTIWLSLLPLTGDLGDYQGVWFLGRGLLSLVFLADLVARSRRSRRRWTYWRRHPLLLAAVVVPPVRVLFSIRLLRTVFRRGRLLRFVVVALMLGANIAILVWGFERSAPDRNIDTVWVALWWAVVTLTTTGYGDYTPVTVGGRVMAVCLMALGITTIGVVTAQLASSFQEQAARLRPKPPPDPHLAELRAQVARLEALLSAQQATAPAAATGGASEGPATGDAPR